jgi:hypothetical protein
VRVERIKERLLAATTHRRAQACVIGPAGERLVRFACVNNNRWHQLGRGGPGAVFGSKNLAAIVVAGSVEVESAAPEALRPKNLAGSVYKAHAKLRVGKLTKPPEQFGFRVLASGRAPRRVCRDCRNAQTREGRAIGKYGNDPAKYAVRRQRVNAKKKALGYPWMRQWRAARKAAGLRVNGNIWERMPQYVARAAKEGREYWPNGCKTRKPAPRRAPRERKLWHVKGLSNAERVALRYKLDPKFRLYHRLRLYNWFGLRVQFVILHSCG